MDNTFMIHIEDYIKHIEDKLELYAMLRQLEDAINKLPKCKATGKVRERMAAFSSEIDRLWEEWKIPKRYLISGELDDLSEVMGDELMEPEDMGYFYDSGVLPHADGSAPDGLELLLTLLESIMALKGGDTYRCKITIHRRGTDRAGTAKRTGC